ncbi:hypothetical protein RI129_012315 [Pyrocoelia pectoralis]|uniref:Large ribosomal subunit protein mL44 n=1 Tax=Pyrocoelia pectoralis TaxID=417401 RepID=A0AAN7USW8_9COLE
MAASLLNNLKLLTQKTAILASKTSLNAIIPGRGIKRWVAPTLRELEKRRKRMGPQQPNPRSSFLEWNYDAELYSFGKRLGEEFKTNLLQKAFTHRSYVIQRELTGNLTETFEDNSDLITEGDSVILKSIRQQYVRYPEEIVDAVCNYLMTNKMLAHVAFYLGTKDIVLTAEFPAEEETLANTFKAIVGALNRSTSEDRAHVFVSDFLICQLNGKDIYEVWDPKNPYDILKQLVGREIEPRLCNESASNTILANYQVGLYDNRQLLGIGWGESVEIAKETAAMHAIKKLYNF